MHYVDYTYVSQDNLQPWAGKCCYNYNNKYIHVGPTFGNIIQINLESRDEGIIHSFIVGWL